jgi:CRISPR-associated protein (TIGR02584 family)
MHNEPQPHDFDRRILLVVAGGSPAIVTETLYALTQTSQPAYLPTEIHIITTTGKFGDQAIRKALLDDQRLQQLYDAYGMTLPPFDDNHIHRITDANDVPLTDITTAEDNEAAADFITNIVRKFTQNDNTSLHASIAGGRKTMSYYMGYALSLYGRMQDRLSHVLVDESLITRDFFFPQPNENIEVRLANVPFVRLRDGLGFAEELTQGKHTFSQAIELVQQQFAPVAVKIDLDGWHCGGIEVQDPKPTRLSVYAWLLERHQHEEPPLRFNGDDADEDYAAELLAMYERLYGIKGIDKMEKALKKGMTADYLRPHISHCNKVLKNSLKQAAKHYLIQMQERAPYVEYCLPEGLTIQAITLDIPDQSHART